jgi:phospholipase/carboxylesterase
MFKAVLFGLVLFLYAGFKPLEKKTTTLTYVYKAPRINTEKTPLLILLHGIGSNENDLFTLAKKRFADC